MRRTDRLFDLIQILRDGKLHRASDMAGALEVSTRTIWRDMATLIASGLPVEGERGVGYILSAPITLPPVALTRDELEALRLGVQLVASAADPPLARAATSLRAKIAAVTPDVGPRFRQRYLRFRQRRSRPAAPHLSLIRRAIRDHERLWLRYAAPVRPPQPSASCGRCNWNSGAAPGP